jgi:hypothetical protein
MLDTPPLINVPNNQFKSHSDAVHEVQGHQAGNLTYVYDFGKKITPDQIKSVKFHEMEGSPYPSNRRAALAITNVLQKENSEEKAVSHNIISKYCNLPKLIRGRFLISSKPFSKDNYV